MMNKFASLFGLAVLSALLITIEDAAAVSSDQDKKRFSPPLLDTVE
jgi:hypothetical protein